MDKNIQIIIPKDVQYIINILENNNYEAFIVGGCVRDSILGRIPNDWDITTKALPIQVYNLFNDLGHTIIETGLKHGTVTVIINQIGYEITTYRLDGEYEDGRHPKEVEFIDDIKIDLSRRDFTINSMAYNSSIGLIDPYNGLIDLKNKIIKCVGRPKDRFNEDALRMLRAIRFSAQLGFNIDCKIKQDMWDLDLYFNLEKVSIERIRDEFNKILLSNIDHVYELIGLYLTDTFMPEINSLKNFNQNNPYHDLDLLQHTLKAVRLVDNTLHIKLAMLFHDFGKIKTKSTDENGISHYYKHAEESVKIAEIILKRMKYDNDTIFKVLQLIKYHDCVLESKASIKRMLNKIEEDLLRDLIKVKWADILSQNAIYAKERLIVLIEVEKILNDIINQKECFSIKDLAINGNDLIKLGYKQGKEIGIILNKLLKRVIEDNNLNEREKLLSLLELI